MNTVVIADALQVAGKVAVEFVKANKKEIIKLGFRLAEAYGRSLIKIWETKKNKGIRDGKGTDQNEESNKDSGGNTESKVGTKQKETSFSFSDIANQTGALPDPIIPGVLYPGDMCTLAGENHSGKSLLMYHIGLCLAQGKQLNLSAEQTPPYDKYEVLVYDRENSNAVLSKRYGGIDVKRFRILRGKDFTSIDDLLDDLELQLKEIPRDSNVLACIDNATAFKMPTSGPKITDFYTRLQSIIDKIQIDDKRLTVIIAAHLSSSATAKRDDARVLGATQLISGASANLYIKNTRFGKHKKILKATKNRLGNYPEDAFLLSIIDEAPWRFEFDRMIAEKDALPLSGSQTQEDSTPPVSEEKTATEVPAHAKATTDSTVDPRRQFTDAEIKEIIRRKNAGERIEDIAKEKGTSMKTLYKWINKYREEHPGE